MKKLFNPLILCVITSLFITLVAYAHPFYVSISSIDFNSNKKQLEISCRIFYDDLELTLKNQQKQKIDIINPKNKAQADSAIANYIRNNFRIKLEGQSKNLSYVGYEVEDDVAWCYFVIPQVQQVNKISISNQLLFQDFKTQSNILHVTVGKNRKSAKLDNPKRTVDFVF